MPTACFRLNRLVASPHAVPTPPTTPDSAGQLGSLRPKAILHDATSG
jgi:hypothetical protein